MKTQTQRGQNAQSSRTTQNRARGSTPAPKPVVNPVEAQIIDLENERDGTTDTVRQGTTVSRFNFVRRAVAHDFEKDAQKASEAAERAKRKNILLSSATQTLAEVQDRLNDVNATEADIASLSGKAAMALYQGLAGDVLSLEEVTAKMGDVFGFRMKGDAKVRVPAGNKDASKTPFGRGEEIRKRVIRLTKANEYLTDGRGDRFFSDVPEDKREGFRSAVQGILSRLEMPEAPEGMEGDELAAWEENAKASLLSPFSAYDMIAQARKDALEGRTTVNAAFDPKKVMALVEALRGPEAGDRIDNNKALAAAYEALGEVLFELAERPVPEIPEGTEGTETE